MTMIVLTDVGVLRSISDDDQCSDCAQCAYMPRAISSCKQEWPCEPDADGYIADCPSFEQNTSTANRAVMLGFGMAPIACKMGFPVIKDLFVGTVDVRLPLNFGALSPGFMRRSCAEPPASVAHTAWG